MKTQHTKASHYHSKFRSTQNVEVPLFSCLGYGALGKGEVFSKNCNLSNLVDIQRQHENDKQITKFHTASLKCFIYSRVGISDSTWRSNLPFLLIYLVLIHKKCNHKKNHTYHNLVYSICQRVDIYRLVKLLNSSFRYYFQ